MAGSSIADIVFIMAIAIVIRRLEGNLSDLGLISHTDTLSTGEFFGLDADDLPLTVRVVNPAFVDDYAVPVFSSTESFFAKHRPW